MRPAVESNPSPSVSGNGTDPGRTHTGNVRDIFFIDHIIIIIIIITKIIIIIIIIIII